MKTEFDWLVLGGGFRSIVAAYGLAQQGKSVVMVEKSNKIGGFLAPIPWGDFWIDKGPQFFDNFEDADVELMQDMLGQGVMQDIGFSYSSYLAGQRDDRFAIPVWQSLGEEFAKNAYNSLFASRVLERQTPPDLSGTFSEYLDFDGGAGLSEQMHAMTQKFLQIEANVLSPRAGLAAPFLGRKVFFEEELSAALKKSPPLDDILAAPKASSGETRYNLYPKGQNLEVVRQKLEKRLIALGVTILKETELASWDHETKTVHLNTCSLKANKLFLGPDLKDCESLFFGTRKVSDKTHVLAEIFHCFTVPIEDVHSSYYVVDYDLNHLSTRMTNFCHYTGSAKKDGIGIFCVEQPVLTDSDAWNNPDSLHDRIFQEAREVGNVTCDNYIEARSFRVPATYKIPFIGIDEAISSVKTEFETQLSDWVTIPDAFTLTRKETIDDLRQLGLLQA